MLVVNFFQRNPLGSGISMKILDKCIGKTPNYTWFKANYGIIPCTFWTRSRFFVFRMRCIIHCKETLKLCSITTSTPSQDVSHWKNSSRQIPTRPIRLVRRKMTDESRLKKRTNAILIWWISSFNLFQLLPFKKWMRFYRCKINRFLTSFYPSVRLYNR